MSSKQHKGRQRLKNLLCASISTVIANVVAANIAMAAPVKLDLPAQPLAQSIMKLAEQAGITIGGDARILEGRQAPRLAGYYEPDEALQLLLKGSGINAQQHDDNAFTLEKNTTDKSPLRKNKKVKVVAKPLDDFGGSSRLSGAQLESIPSTNSNLSDMLDRLPGISSSGRGRGSIGAGELTPENISINGARFFQNSFVVDGVSVNNDLDPGFSDPNDANRIGSNAQGLYIDLNSIASVTVHDHNVSAEHGRFVGGVIDAETKRFEGVNSFSASWRHTSDDLTQYHYDDGDKDEFDDGGSLGRFSAFQDIQPRFEKNFYNMSGSFAHGENWGSVITASRKSSTIPLLNPEGQAYQINTSGDITVLQFDNAGDITQKRDNENVTIKTSWQPGNGQVLDFKLLYGKARSEYQLGGLPGSGFKLDHNSLSFGIDYSREVSLGKFNISFDITEMEDERLSSNNVYGVITGITPRTTDAAGGHPAMQRKQKSVSLKPKFAFDQFALGNTLHKVTAGGELTRKNLEENKSEDTYIHVFSCWPQCNVDGLTHFNLTHVTPYEIDIDHDQVSLWVEDTIEFSRWSLRPGIRVDRDEFIAENTVAPRFAAKFDVFDDGDTTLNFGANRYYGRAFAELEAQRIRDLARTTTLNPGTPFEFVLPSGTEYEELKNLKTPFDTEYTLGVNQIWNNWQFGLQWVRRYGRDQIVNIYDPDTRTRSFSNDGSSRNDQVSLVISTLEDYFFAGAQWGLNTQLSWSERESNQVYQLQGGSAVYNQGVGLPFGVTRTDIVFYDDDIIDANALPVNSFDSPVSASIDLSTEWQQINLTMNNYLTWRDEYTTLSDNGVYTDTATGDKIRAYEKFEFADSTTWDMQLRWQPAFNELKPYVQLDIINVLDQSNVAKGSGSTTSYDIGRQFWIEVGVSL